MNDRERKIEAARWSAQEDIRADAMTAGAAAIAAGSADVWANDPWGTDDPPYWTAAGRRLRQRWIGGGSVGY